jgi:hypothetical protein
MVYITWNFQINMMNKITQKHFETIVTNVIKLKNTLFWLFEVFEVFENDIFLVNFQHKP